VVELASIVGFLVALLVSTIIIYVVTRPLGGKEGFSRAILAPLIIWQRTCSHNDLNNFGNFTDHNLYYDKSNRITRYKQYSFRG
jgi:hypothetical protein